MVSKDKVRELIRDYAAEKFAAVVKLSCAPSIFAVLMPRIIPYRTPVPHPHAFSGRISEF